jgi:Mn2+/Fe2+ NRAMP family transporter
MKAATIVGILLIILAIIGFAVGGISFTHQKKDVDMGPLQVSHKQTSTVPISPILSVISLIAGVGLVVVGVRNK